MLMGDGHESFLLLGEYLGLQDDAVIQDLGSLHTDEHSVREGHRSDVFAVLPGDDSTHIVFIDESAIVELQDEGYPGAFYPAKVIDIVHVISGVYVSPLYVNGLYVFISF